MATGKCREPVPPETRFTLLGVGAMNSPRYSPAGLLIEHGQVRVAIDGGLGAEPAGPLAAWLVTDERAELIRELRRLTASHGLSPAVRAYHADGLTVTPQPVLHTSHPAYGYLIEASGMRVAWAPEFLKFPSWAAGTDLMFAEAAGWTRPIRFAGGRGRALARTGGRRACCSAWRPAARVYPHRPADDRRTGCGTRSAVRGNRNGRRHIRAVVNMTWVNSIGSGTIRGSDPTRCRARPTRR